MSVSENTAGQMSTFYGQSDDSYDSAVKTAVTQAGKDLPGKTLEWFEVIEFRGGIKAGNIACFQIAIRVGYA